MAFVLVIAGYSVKLLLSNNNSLPASQISICLFVGCNLPGYVLSMYEEYLSNSMKSVSIFLFQYR